MTDTEVFNICPVLKHVLNTTPSYKNVFYKLLDHNLHRLFTYYFTNATPQQICTLLKEAEQLDFAHVARHQKMIQANTSVCLKPEDVEPVHLMTIKEQEQRRLDDETVGIDSLKKGKWAAITFAGGAGTRFVSGLDQLYKALPNPNEVLRRKLFDSMQPKGTFPISPVGGMTFYDLIIAEALSIGVKLGYLPWVLFLTSKSTHAKTVEYLMNHDLWGFPKNGLLAFQQANVPRLDARGDLVVVDDDGHLAWTGNGHGGVYQALMKLKPDKRNVLDRLYESGVQHLVMHNLDNAAAHPLALARLGFHLRERALFTLSAICKNEPTEKLGLLIRPRSTHKVEVIEYNVITPSLACQRDEKTGCLVHKAGHINTNLVACEALRQDIDPILYTDKVITSRGKNIVCSSLEMLNQNLTHVLDPTRVRAYEVKREDFFMPTKSITGSHSVASTVNMLSSHSRCLLASAGASVSENAVCDLNVACGTLAHELIDRGIGPGWKISENARVYLCACYGTNRSGKMVGSPGLVLEPNSTLVIDAARPYGSIYLDKLRNLKVDQRSASRVSIERNVVVRKGVRVIVRVGPAACLRIPHNRTFDRDIEVEIGPGEDREL